MAGVPIFRSAQDDKADLMFLGTCVALSKRRATVMGRMLNRKGVQGVSLTYPMATRAENTNTAGCYLALTGYCKAKSTKRTVLQSETLRSGV